MTEQNQKEWATKHHHALWNMGYGNDDMARNGEFETMGYVAGVVGEDAMVFDVGANCGYYLKVLTGVFPPSTEFHAFEPALLAYKALCNNMGGNAPRIFLHSIGFSDEERIANLYKVDGGTHYSGLSSIYQRDLSSVDLTMDVTEVVKLASLDTFCESLKIKHIHFLKLDVEGHELAVLAGAKQMLEGDGYIRIKNIKGSIPGIPPPAIDFIQFEFGGCNVDARTFFRDFYKLLNPQYAIYRITADGGVLIDKYNVELEIFTTTNYLCVGRHIQEPPQFLDWNNL